MDDFIYSRYNFLFILSNGLKVLYNSATNKIYEISEELYEFLLLAKDNQEMISCLEEPKRQELIAKEVIVSKDYYETFYNKLLNEYSLRNNSSILRLVIVPTFQCNCGCSYCFEQNKGNGHMSDEIVDKIVRFINSFQNIKGISISWFGGEPLLALNKIKKIIDKIHVESTIPILNNSMVSNGYCINKRVCNFFNDYKINHIQITFDGKQETHDSLRVLKNGSGTFRVILNNIKLLKNECPNLKINIRVNISQENKQEYLSLKEYLYKELGEDNITVYPGFIFNYNTSQTQLIFPSLSLSEKKDFFLQSKELVLPSFSRCKKNCSATQTNSFIIGPLGELYKCWEDVNIPSKIVGTLDGLKNHLELINMYISTSCFQDPKCMKCEFLPICSGGCCRKRIVNYFENGAFELCTLYKDTDFLKKCIEKCYERNM